MVEKFLFSDTVSPFAKIATAKSEFIGRADAGKMSGKEEKICDFGEESFSCSKISNRMNLHFLRGESFVPDARPWPCFREKCRCMSTTIFMNWYLSGTDRGSSNWKRKARHAYMNSRITICNILFEVSFPNHFQPDLSGGNRMIRCCFIREESCLPEAGCCAGSRSPFR